MNRLRILALPLALAFASASAQVADDIDRNALDEHARRSLEQASGFVIDRTITNFGAEFVRHFSQAWREEPGSDGVDLTLVERPSARYGSLVWVEHNNRPVVRVFLYAGRGGTIRPAAEAAARYVARQVADESLAAQLMTDPDLAKDGF